MANYLASIFGTEQDVSPLSLPLVQIMILTVSAESQLFLLLQNWCLQARRSMLTKARQAIVLTNHSSTQPLPEPSLRPEKQDECFAAAKPLRRVL